MSDMKVTERSGEKSIEFVVNEAVNIFKDIKSRGNRSKKTLDQLFDIYAKKYTDFSKTYPLVLRLMIAELSFSKKVFEKYLDKVSKNKWKNQDEFLESQVDYACMLFRHQNPKVQQNVLQNYRKSMMNGMTKERDDFKKKFEKGMDDFEQLERDNAKERREELLKLIENAKK